MPSKKPTKSKLVKKLDILFSKWVRLSNSDDQGYCYCVTCSKKYFWKEIQAGHFMSRKHYSTRWDEDNVKPQCVGCNVYKSGEQYRYSVYLGKEKSEELYNKSLEIKKHSIQDIEEMIDLYREKLKNYAIFEK